MATPINIYQKWALFYEFRICHTVEDAYKLFLDIYDREVLSMEVINEWFKKFRDQGEKESLRELRRDEREMQLVLSQFAMYCNENPRPVKDVSLLRLVISKLSDSEITTFTKVLTGNVPNGTIMTPLCYVFFPPGGYSFSFPMPTAYNPPEDFIKRLFAECSNMTKMFKRHGRRMSLHEILCDLYEKDPKTFWLSDEELIMLPLWLPHVRPINRLVEDGSNAFYETFYRYFSGANLLSWNESTVKNYQDKLLKRVENKVVAKIETLALHYSDTTNVINEDNTSVTRSKDVERDLLLCSSYAFLEQLIFVMILPLVIRHINENGIENKAQIQQNFEEEKDENQIIETLGETLSQLDFNEDLLND